MSQRLIRHGPEIYAAAAKLVREDGGILYWIGGRMAGKPVRAYPNMTGHLRFEVPAGRILVHRMVWYLRTGNMPSGVIDHINDNPSDNRFENLRDVSSRLNNHRNKKLGVLFRRDPPAGCVRRSGANSWSASVYVGRENGNPTSGYCHLGTFETEDEAKAAHIGATKIIERFFEFDNLGGFQAPEPSHLARYAASPPNASLVGS